MRRWNSFGMVFLLVVFLVSLYSCDIMGIGDDDDKKKKKSSGSADLVMTSVQVNGSSSVDSITLNMSNDGDAGASDFEAVVVFWEYDSGSDTIGDNFYIVYVFGGLSLGSGDSMSRTVQWANLDLSSVPVPGEYVVYGFVDANEEVSEPDENNNANMWAGWISVS